MPKLSGITCGNFGVRSNGGLICSGAWCAICFHQDPLVKFPVLGVKDLDNSLVDEGFLIEDDLTRFMLARDGDHLMTPFQCENCHFFNMRSRPRKHGLPADDLLAICIRRATIDSFWSRERTTVSSNLRLAKRYLVDQEALGSELNGLPSRGPYPHDDVWGMNIACGILLKSLDKGRNAELVQYETIRRLRSICPQTLYIPVRKGVALALYQIMVQDLLYQIRQQTAYFLNVSCRVVTAEWEMCGSQMPQSQKTSWECVLRY